ncbi:hypothetical protein COT98_04025 [Candidatus Falkowbacteria bacterium CG10_big_fil_rev_8_21_14_0_10_39_9]|uniref:Amino acid ABC transporter substrate-binding protein n=1 Tax=Candidatus Falkowbacteria bacterium CG10_big_fil_rev_8_21_14_0_10_39_9 TaxID=1974566 RepID=A0A2M6WNP5_9BACT|nr:MAG: hypothetical protein COT98_04025 [Candidatus Falkowbacteria bacterium CG10_big_fil_rev_8_21_14_0_10_39_9]
MILGLVLGFFWWNKNKSDLSNTSTDPSLNNVKNSGKLIIGVDFSYGVMELFDANGQPAGVDIDLGREVASRLGVQAEFKEFDWDNLLPIIENKEVDLVISSITITEDRAKTMLFSSPYFNGGQVILTKIGNDTINSINDLKNQKIGVQIDTTSQEAAQKITSSTLITTYKTWENSKEKNGIIYDLKSDKLDAIIVDYIQGVDSTKNDSEIKIVGEPFTQEYYGIATNLSNNSLIQAVNEALRSIKNGGTLKKIQDKWTKS